jgi:trans-aconitate 2-methyltransferase
LYRRSQSCYPSSVTWDPVQYAKFADHRLRPALDLLNRIPVESAEEVVDLGCGSGDVTARLAERWRGARVTGIDDSREMLAAARQRYPGLVWQQADLAGWSAVRPADVVYSNAALHWAGDHGRLFPHLLAQLRGGGALAVQMPNNFSAPTHAIAHQLAASERWRARLESLIRPAPVADPCFYYDLLVGRASRLDIWETEYLQPLSGEHPVLEWIKGSWLRPFLAALGDADARAFEDEYSHLAAQAYPRRPDGVTLLPFRRLFLVAIR